MSRKQMFLAFSALGLTCTISDNVQAQSLNYGISISSLPAQVGKSFTVTVPVPATVPDGTAFNYVAGPQPADGTYLQATGVSLHHQLTIQAPAFTAPGLYEISVSQAQGSTSVGSVTPSALNPAIVDLLVSPAGQNPNPPATFTGNYSFLLKGHTAAVSGAEDGAAIAGTFSTDGNGKITSGTLDLNTAAGVALQNASVTGSYQLDATGKGSLLLKTTAGVLNFRFFVPPAKPGIVVNDASIVPSGGFTGTGEISRVQNFFASGTVFAGSSQFTTVPLNTSVLYEEESVPALGFQAGEGLLAFNEDLTLSGVGQAVPGVPDLFTAAAGTYSNQSTTGFFADTGRSTITLSAPGQASTTPSHFAFYQGSSGSSGINGVRPVLYFLSLDPHPAEALVIGKIQY